MDKNIIQQFFNKAQSLRKTTENSWEDIALYFNPNRGDIVTQTTKGSFRDPRQIHPAPVNVSTKLASRITSDLTDIAVNKFQLNKVTKTVGDIDEANRWADEISRLTRHYFQLPEVNFQSSNASVTYDGSTFGTGVLSIRELDNFPYINYKAVHIGRVWLLENSNGMVDTVFEELKLTGRQVLQEFDEDKLSKDMKDKCLDQPHEYQCIIKFVLPSEDAKRYLGIKEVNEYTIIYFEKENFNVIETSGIYFFPYAVNRFDQKTGEVYGKGPAWEGLPYARQLTSLQIQMAKAFSMNYNPIMLTADDSIFPKGRIAPGQRLDGGIDLSTNQRTVDWLTYPVNLAEGFNKEKWLVEKLERLFYVEGLPDNKNVRMTQVEVQARLAELKALAPNVSKIVNEYLNTILVTTYKILSRKKVLPKKPESLKNEQFEFNFSGSLTNVYKYSDAESLQQLYGLLSQVAQFDPSVLASIKHEEVVRAYVDIFNVPKSILKSDEELQIERQQQAQQQALMQQAELAKTFGEAGAAASRATEGSGVI